MIIAEELEEAVSVVTTTSSSDGGQRTSVVVSSLPRVLKGQRQRLRRHSVSLELYESLRASQSVAWFGYYRGCYDVHKLHEVVPIATAEVSKYPLIRCLLDLFQRPAALLNPSRRLPSSARFLRSRNVTVTTRGGGDDSRTRAAPDSRKIFRAQD